MNLMRYLPRFQGALRSLPTMAERETWPRSAIEAFQLDWLNTVWKHAVACVPYYRGLRTKAGLPLRFSSLSAFRLTVPVLSKSEVRTKPQGFLSEQPRRGEWRRTSGSSDTPISVYWASETHFEMPRTRYRFYPCEER